MQRLKPFSDWLDNLDTSVFFLLLFFGDLLLSEEEELKEELDEEGD